jgi:glutamate racemase
MNLSARNPIGIFDSGVGGLTVLRELHRQLPQESIIYFADTARLPYGIRSQNEILQYVREINQWLLTQEVKMIIMACNTSSALALDLVRTEWEIPIVGLILPGAAVAVATGRRIGVIATPATAKSQAYRRGIQALDPRVEVWEVGCPEFVPLIEQNRIEDSQTEAVARKYLQPLLQANIDTLVYGCTHYPHLEGVLRRILPPTVRLVDPAVAVVKAAQQELEQAGLQNLTSGLPTRFCVSGCPEKFTENARRWLPDLANVEKVYLQSANCFPLPVESVDSILYNNKAI